MLLTPYLNKFRHNIDAIKSGQVNKLLADIQLIASYSHTAIYIQLQ